ncbi:MAG: hypothetical protein K6D97_02820 [Clostridia bacterium]|nr:hypothetical protein [Clostridia bacterium]
MKKFIIIVLLLIGCFAVEGVFIFKSGNNKEAKLGTFNEDDTQTNGFVNNIDENSNTNEQIRDFKWEVTK